MSAVACGSQKAGHRLEPQAALCSQNPTGEEPARMLAAQGLCPQYEPLAGHGPAILVLWERRREQKLLVASDQYDARKLPAWTAVNRKCILRMLAS